MSFFTLYNLINFDTLKPRSVKISLALPFIETSVKAFSNSRKSIITFLSLIKGENFAENSFS
jgi:hypothetical protein